ncbi:MAG TPA: zf-HC2 domain-containing protein [Methylomirabilota bacterium]|nr:zf-HC2 domain-containing protein [Methylomirabilota bacterium]
MIDCNFAKAKVFPYVDGELAAAVREEMEAHLVGCATCRRLVEGELSFREACREWLHPEPAPERVRGAVAETLGRLVERDRARRGRRLMKRVGLMAAGLALVALGAGGGMALHAYLQSKARITEFAAAAVEQHQKLVRNVLPPDVTGISPKGAEQWFKQRLGFNMNLPELPTDGLSFIGGRISHVRDIEAAALEYELEGKRVSLFIMPEEAYRRLNPADKPRFTVLSHRGYDVILWQSNGTGYTLVSEVGGRSCLVCHSPSEKVEETIPQRTRSPARL